ncbi:hypothetical protein LK12_09400 [Novosphingobium malaysiense]|uniref:Two component regulator three Y domain-containing protein n=1 Tax=Novosphingobium malaysiense TaxID=1348853 RepID=A0A0B1ZLD7_9SPHN|nr:hypothetical protein LK12_09400 [Novosphingobium malaysiense]
MFAALFAAIFALAVPAHAAAHFEGPSELTSDAGHAMLEWQSDSPVSLEISTSPDFSKTKQLYAGSAHRYFLSGLANGDYYLRLKTLEGQTSTPLLVSVVHQSLNRALFLVAIGALVTLAVVITILRGARDE